MKKLLPLLIVITFAGCKKDTVDLITRSWKTTEITMHRNGTSTPIDITPCSENRIWTFREDGTFSSEPTSNCTPDGLEFALNGTWKLMDNKTLKIEAIGGYAGLYTQSEIVSISRSKLILRQAVDFSGRRGVPPGVPWDGQIIYTLKPR